ncbi:helix-turn-helix domain-containing protein, partial [Enterobacter hormaechei subsp. steigerwaltii]|nr:helix-turn-helix domain-containing protein [Enterobacter hormaechei subsp. steigerwaltii]
GFELALKMVRAERDNVSQLVQGQRQFKAHFHVTPHQMLMAIRLWRAKAFLTHGMPAAEVAAATGLTDQSHLTRAFTRRYGITPVRYQKQVMPR